MQGKRRAWKRFWRCGGEQDAPVGFLIYWNLELPANNNKEEVREEKLAPKTISKEWGSTIAGCEARCKALGTGVIKNGMSWTSNAKTKMEFRWRDSKTSTTVVTDQS